jgi:eukaryotic-like serine/threonine-protein kinase
MALENDDRPEQDADPRGVTADASFAFLRSLKRAILAEQSEDWSEGRPSTPEGLLGRWPVDPVTDPDAASVLAEDFFQRRHRGEMPSVQEYEERFPEHARSFTGLIAQRNLLCSIGGTSSSEGASLRLPDIGDEVFGFRLRDSLGRGAFTRVFLAEQAELADRPVVLKVSAIEGTEPQTLAQLQHTHIVPIYSVHEDARAGLRAVCMPYFGGASLSAVLKKVFEGQPRPAAGREFVTALGAVQSPVPAVAAGLAPAVSASASGQTPLKTLTRLSYVQATVWIAARLAEGLQHAHQRGVLHRDVAVHTPKADVH